jgi:glycine/D-amino acid oxidase-like deaminating enzyme
MTAETEVIVIGAGQSGLAAARALQAHGLDPVVLEAGPEPAGSWPHYYDSYWVLAAWGSRETGPHVSAGGHGPALLATGAARAPAGAVTGSRVADEGRVCPAGVSRGLR